MNKRVSFFKKLYTTNLIALVPLILFGFYKNGIQPYQKGLVEFINMFKPVIVLALGALGALIGGILREKKKDEKLDFKLLDKCKGNVLEAILAISILPLKSSPLLVFLATFLVSLFLNKIKLNRIVLMYLAIEGVNVLFKLNSFFNAYDESTILNYDGIDLLFGFGPGGIFSTSILLIGVAFLILCFNKLYKKDVSISAIITFLILGIGRFVVIGNYGDILPFIFGYNILFTLVFIAPNLYSSSYTVRGQILSGVLIGLMTFLLSFITPYTAAPLAVLIASLFKGVFDRIFVIK